MLTRKLSQYCGYKYTSNKLDLLLNSLIMSVREREPGLEIYDTLVSRFFLLILLFRSVYINKLYVIATVTKNQTEKLF